MAKKEGKPTRRTNTCAAAHNLASHLADFRARPVYSHSRLRLTAGQRVAGPFKRLVLSAVLVIQALLVNFNLYCN